MTVRNYSSTAQPTTLTSGISNSATTISVAATTGFPTAPFVLALDFDVVGVEELVEVTGVAGTDLTVTRGFDGTTAVSHLSGAIVRHVICGQDLEDSRAHENTSSGVHGVSGSVVGTSDGQTLTNKTITAATMGGTFPGNHAYSGDVTFTGLFAATGIGGKTDVAKTADESVSSSTTLQDDNHLTTFVAANATYRVKAVLIYDGEAFGGLKTNWVAPASATFTGGTYATSGQPTIVEGTLVTSGTSGIFKLQWAQVTSNATATTVKSGSFMVLQRIA